MKPRIETLEINREVEIESAPDGVRCEDCEQENMAEFRIVTTTKDRRTYIVDLCERDAYFWLHGIGFQPKEKATT